ncbi:MAG: DNA repair protein RecO [Ghiorsea sp.]
MAEQRDIALLLRSIPYSDSSLILHILTQNNGRISLMARGARRAKSPFRAGLMPLHQLRIRWRTPRTGSMGTLLEVQRLTPLLPDSKILAGQALIATASSLFPEGVDHGHNELYHALQLLINRPEDAGICAATWKMLEFSGWVSDFEHCWHCSEAIDMNQSMYWKQAHLFCQACANQQGFHVSSGDRKSIAGHLIKPNIKLNQAHINLWQIMIQAVFQEHHIHQA